MVSVKINDMNNDVTVSSWPLHSRSFGNEKMCCKQTLSFNKIDFHIFILCEDSIYPTINVQATNLTQTQTVYKYRYVTEILPCGNRKIWETFPQ